MKRNYGLGLALLSILSLNMGSQTEAADRGGISATSPSAVLRGKLPNSIPNTVPGRLPSKLKTLPPVSYVAHLVLDEEKERVVETKYGRVICAPHSVAYVYQSKNSLAVFVLDERKKHDVQIALGDKFVTVAPAREVVVSHLSDAKFMDVNPKLGILFRFPKSEQPVNDSYIYNAEFLIEKAVERIGGIRRLAVSDDPAERKLLHRILKNAAVLQPTA